jgi:hypothetical protein
MLKIGLEKYILSGDYFSFDYIKSNMPGCEAAIKKYATRKLQYGYLVTAFVLPEKKVSEFYAEMKKNCHE